MRIKLFLICVLALSALSLAYGTIYSVDSDTGWNEWTGVSQYPAARLSDGNVIVYFVDSTGDLYARKSTNTGLTAWTDRVKICGNGGIMQSDTAFTHFNALVMPTRDRSSFYIFVWSYSDTSLYTVYLRVAKVDPANWDNANGYKGVQNTGASYDVIKTLSNLDSYGQLVPDGLAVDSLDQPHVAYSYTSTNDWDTNSNTYYKYFNSSSGTWSSESTLTTEAGYAGGPLSIDSTDGLGMVRGKGRTNNIDLKFSWCDDASTGSCTNTNNWKTTPQGSTTGWGTIATLYMHDVLDMAVDRNNRFFVVVDDANQGNNNLYYMWNGTGWSYKGASTAYGHIGAMADSDGIAGIYANDVSVMATLKVNDTLTSYVVYDGYAERTAGSEKFPLSSASNRYFFFRPLYTPDLYVVTESQSSGANQWWDSPTGGSSSINSCQNLTTPDTTYTLSADIIGNQLDDYCIDIQANNITLDCDGKNITGNESGTFGIYTEGYNNTIIMNCDISNYSYGVYISTSSNNTLTNNTVNDNIEIGIEIYSNSNSTLINNTVSFNHDVGLYVYSGSNNTLINNTVNSNTNEGVAITSSSDNTIANNTCKSNQRGIYLDGSAFNIIANNTANSNSYGIYLYSTSNNTFTNNNATNNSGSDFYSVAAVTNNNDVIINLTTNNTLSSFTYGGSILLKSAAAPAGGDPSFYYNIGKYLSITNGTAGAWVYLNISYTDSDMTGLNELTTAIFKYNGSWYDRSAIASVYGVNEVDNYVYANITRFSTFAPMAQLGAGGTSYPEFSDFAYVLAAVLGAGGFMLVKKRYF